MISARDFQIDMPLPTFMGWLLPSGSAIPVEVTSQFQSTAPKALDGQKSGEEAQSELTKLWNDCKKNFPVQVESEWEWEAPQVNLTCPRIVCRSNAFAGAHKIASFFEKKYGLNCTSAEDRLYIAFGEKERELVFSRYDLETQALYSGTKFKIEKCSVEALSDRYIVTHRVWEKGSCGFTQVSEFSLTRFIKHLIIRSAFIKETGLDSIAEAENVGPRDEYDAAHWYL